MTFDEWKQFANDVRDRADRVNAMRHARGWKIAATVGIPRDGCAIHNASIDRTCQGWSADGPHVWKTARRARRFIDDWTAARLTDRIIARAWNQYAATEDLARSPVPARPEQQTVR